MNKAADIRLYFRPIQPTVAFSAEDVIYSELAPDVRLQDYIYCYWQLKTAHPLPKSFNHLIVADGCTDIYFDLNNPRDSYVMGFCNCFTEFRLDNTFSYGGIRFLPTMFSQLFRVNAKELSNKAEPLENVVPAISYFIQNNLNKTATPDQVKNILDRYFLQSITNKPFNNDKRLYGAIDLILKNPGAVNVEKDLDTGISPRQLRRLFEFYIGDTAKSFSKVVRFQTILRAKPSSQSLRQNKPFFDAGYYDQAHFIKEFKNLYGLTPGKAL